MKPRGAGAKAASGLIAAIVPGKAVPTPDCEEESDSDAAEPSAVEGAANGSEAAIVTTTTTTRMIHNNNTVCSLNNVAQNLRELPAEHHTNASEGAALRLI